MGACSFDPRNAFRQELVPFCERLASLEDNAKKSSEKFIYDKRASWEQAWKGYKKYIYWDQVGNDEYFSTIPECFKDKVKLSIARKEFEIRIKKFAEEILKTENFILPSRITKNNLEGYYKADKVFLYFWAHEISTNIKNYREFESRKEDSSLSLQIRSDASNGQKYSIKRINEAIDRIIELSQELVILDQELQKA